MEYIHELTEESFFDIKSMLLSNDESTVNFGVEIINNLNLKDDFTREKVVSLVLDTEYLLAIKFFDTRLSGKDVKGFINDIDYYALEAEHLDMKHFTFYSTKFEHSGKILVNHYIKK